MFLVQPRFWLRVLSTSVVVALVAFGITAMGLGHWGPCGPSDGWGFFVALAGLLSVATAAATMPALALSMALGALLRHRQPQRFR